MALNIWPHQLHSHSLAINVADRVPRLMMIVAFLKIGKLIIGLISLTYSELLEIDIPIRKLKRYKIKNKNI